MELLIGLGGVVLGYALAELNDRWLKKPNIKIAIGKPADGDNHRFLHIDVSNSQRKGLGKFFRGDVVAEYAKAKIKILDPSSGGIICEYIARWSSKAEPMESIDYVSNSGSFSPASAIDAETEIILPGEIKPITVLVKQASRSHFSGFNNWSYIHKDWEDPKLTADIKSAILEIELYVKGKRLNKRFSILNPSNDARTFKLSTKVNS